MNGSLAIGERTDAGMEIRLRQRGAGRYFGAAFLSLWLCGWAAGEAFVLWVLGRGVLALLSGQPLEPGRDPTALAPALLVALFLLVWLTFWTLGGIMAMRELMRSFWAGERIVMAAGELIVESTLGPFRSRRVIASHEITGVRLVARTGAVVVETRAASLDAARLGTRAEREATADLLRRELGIDERAGKSGAATLPEGWKEILTPEGIPVLATDPAVRAKQARVAGGFAFAIGTGTTFLVRAALVDPSLAPLAIIAALVTAAATWGAVWLAQGRIEWRIGSGRIVQQRRFRDQVRERFEATALELTSSADSDGDEWTAVEALAPGATALISGAPLAERARVQRKLRRRIHHAMNDDAAPRRLALWLSQRAGVPLADRTTPEARTAELAELRARLENAGQLGRLAGRLIDRMGDSRRR